jgi:hypothetical protein
MMGPWLIFAALLNRATIALFDGAPTTLEFGKFVSGARVTMLGVVPSLVRAWRSSGCMEGQDWSSIRCFSSSGEVCCHNSGLSTRRDHRPWFGLPQVLPATAFAHHQGTACLCSPCEMVWSPSCFERPCSLPHPFSNALRTLSCLIAQSACTSTSSSNCRTVWPSSLAHAAGIKPRRHTMADEQNRVQGCAGVLRWH